MESSVYRPQRQNERRNGRQQAYGSGEAAAIDLLRDEILPDLHVIDVTIYLRGRASLWTALNGAILFLAIKRPWGEGIVCGDLTASSSPRVGAVAECRLWQLFLGLHTHQVESVRRARFRSTLRMNGVINSTDL